MYLVPNGSFRLFFWSRNYRPWCWNTTQWGRRATWVFLVARSTNGWGLVGFCQKSKHNGVRKKVMCENGGFQSTMGFNYRFLLMVSADHVWKRMFNQPRWLMTCQWLILLIIHHLRCIKSVSRLSSHVINCLSTSGGLDRQHYILLTIQANSC